MEKIRKEPKTPEARQAEKARRMLEKAMRVPLNDTVLQIQNGTIGIKDLFSRIEMMVKEKKGAGNG